MKLNKIFPFFLGFLMACNSCSARLNNVAKTPSELEIKSLSNNEVVKSNNAFGFKLFKEISETQKDKNIFLAPASISMVLAMTYNGAVGQTKETMAKTLEIQGISTESLNSSYDVLRRLMLTQDEQVTLNIANSLWVKEDISLKPDFVAANEKYYDARVSTLDFNNASAPSTINKWVAENTGNKIPKLIEQIDASTILFLINAIYFKGTWTSKFEEQNTSNREFNLPGGKTKQHPMMNQTKEFNFYEDDKVRVLSMPYGKEKFSMNVILPAEDSGLTELYKTLDSTAWTEWSSKLRKRKVRVSFPKFKLEYDVTLNEPLKSLGMETAFTPAADFSAMVDGKALITEVKHKTFIEVNEAGTEAAGATSVAVGRTSVEITPEFIADRPFLYAITDDVSGTILFLGALNEPKL